MPMTNPGSSAQISNIKIPLAARLTAPRLHQHLDRVIADLRSACGCGLHLGCGETKLPGLINCDLYHPGADRQIDALTLEGIADQSVDLIESHHLLEHFSLAEVPIALAHWQRALIPGGWLILTCPDLSAVCLKWLKYSLSYRITRLIPRLATIVDGTRDYLVKMFVGPQDYEGMYHRSGFDKHSLRNQLENAGFEVVVVVSGYPKRPTPSLCLLARKKR